MRPKEVRCYQKFARTRSVLARTGSLSVRRELPYGRCLHEVEALAVAKLAPYGRRRTDWHRRRVPRLSIAGRCLQRTELASGWRGLLWAAVQKYSRPKLYLGQFCRTSPLSSAVCSSCLHAATGNGDRHSSDKGSESAEGTSHANKARGSGELAPLRSGT